MPSTPPELPKHPLIDTTVLFDFLLWRFCVDTKTPFPGCMSDNFSEENARRALHWYLDNAKPINTSPHVIAEIHGLVQARADWHGSRLSAFWEFAQEELARLLLDEHLVKLVKMNREDLGTFGPTDDSILELAAQTGCAVVTEDHPLMGRLTQKQIPTLGLYQIRDLWEKWNA